MSVFDIFSLPPELVVHILDVLDYRSLLRCSQVCHLFANLIKGAAALQYKIELAIAKMDDGPPSALSTSDRLQKLKQHQDAWATLTPTSQKFVPMMKGEVWELYGGVLSQARDSSTIAFAQLPSELRGIEEKNWIVENLGFKIRDYGMDPSQDLLVIIQALQSAGNSVQIHLRQLSTGAPHPAAPNPAVLSCTPQGSQHSFIIQVSSDYLGVHFNSQIHNEIDNELLIWNWKTGALQLWLSGREMASFAFLSDRHVMLGLILCPLQEDDMVFPLPEPQLLVVDYIQANREKILIKDADFLCGFHYPVLAEWVVPLSFSIRSDPAPSWKPHRDLRVPFHVARSERLFVLTFWVADSGHIRSLVLFTLTSVIQSHIDSLSEGEKGRRFTWEEWGPKGSRMMLAPQGHSSVWVCYVLGMKFVSSRRWDMQKGIQVYDFNIAPSQRRLAQVNSDSDAEMEKHQWISGATTLQGTTIFENEVFTSLPYRVQVLYPPADEDDENERDFDAVMLSEDTLITLRSRNRSRKYRLLTF